MQLIRNFEILDVNGKIANNLEILDVIYVKYKKTGSCGIIVNIVERNIFHYTYWNTPLIKDYTYIPLIDRNGNPIRHKQWVSAKEDLFIQIPHIKSFQINPDWLPRQMTHKWVDDFNKRMYNDIHD
jgi:hypothetical protein